MVVSLRACITSENTTDHAYPECTLPRRAIKHFVNTNPEVRAGAEAARLESVFRADAHAPISGSPDASVGGSLAADEQHAVPA